jgi:hypothetical protein
MKQNSQNDKISNRCLENTTFCLSTLTLLATLLLTLVGSAFFAISKEPYPCFVTPGTLTPTSTGTDVSYQFKVLCIAGFALYTTLLLNLLISPLVSGTTRKCNNGLFKVLVVAGVLHTAATLMVRCFFESGKVCAGDYLTKGTLTAEPYLVK